MIDKAMLKIILISRKSMIQSDLSIIFLVNPSNLSKLLKVSVKLTTENDLNN